MSFALAGALAAALAAMCAAMAPRPLPAALPARAIHPDARALAAAGWSRPLWQWEGLRWACVLVAIACASAAPFLVVPATLGAAVAPSVIARLRADAAGLRARKATTRLLRGAEATLRSGGALPEALRRAIDASVEPLTRRPFADALRAFDLGAPLDEALRTAASTTADRRVRVALETLALGVSSRLPADRSGVLVGAVADRLAFEERLDEEIGARTAGMRSQMLLLAAIVPGMAIYLALTVPSLAATLSGPLGRMVLIPVAVALEVAGIVASRRALAGAGR